MKIAIVYDWIDKWGGVERLLLALHEQYPNADWYTSYYDKKSAPWAKNLHIKTSFIQHLPAFIRKNRVISLLLYPYAFESFDLSAYDIVISVTSSFAKSVITKPQTKHICYLLTPTRYLWGMTDAYLSEWQQVLLAPLLRKLRKWDYIAAQRPDKIITLSHHVAKRCKTYYERDVQVLYPPFNIDYWEDIKKQIMNQAQDDANYYLVVSRAEPYKKIDLIIDLFNNRKDKLVIISTGSQLSQLKQKASSHIFFKENLTDQQLALYYTHAKALIIPQDEDFGYIALEAQFFGCPVISFNHSGVKEILTKENQKHVVAQQSVLAFQHELERFEAVAYNVESRKKVDQTHFQQFSHKKFINTFESYLKTV